MTSGASIRLFFKGRWKYIKEAWPVELAVLKKGWPYMLGGIISLLIHNWVHNMAYYYAGKYKVYGPYKGPNNPIHDFGFEWFGTAFVGWSMPPGDIVLYITLIIGISFAVRPLFFAFPTRTMNILWRVLTMSIFTVTGRCISFIFTLLPSSAEHCSEDEFDPPKNWGAIFTHLSVSGGCSDLIYSGHMMYALLCTCALCNTKEWEGQFLVAPFLLEIISGSWTLSYSNRQGRRALCWGNFVKFFITSSGFKQDINLRCGIVGELTVLSISVRYAQNWYIKIISLLLNILQGFVIVASRAHYSVDVIVAAYTIPAFWCTFAYFVPDDIGPNTVPLPKASVDVGGASSVLPDSSGQNDGVDLELGPPGVTASSSASVLQDRELERDDRA